MFTQRLNITNQDARAVSATQLADLGSIAETADGRTYRYSLNGAVDLAAGKFNTSPAKVANHTNIAVAAAAVVNARSVSVTLAATATTAGQYDGGYLVVIDVAGQGCAYRIAGTPVIASSGTGVIQLAEGIATALTTSSKVSLVPNPWSGSIISASAVALFCNGTNNVAVTAANYYWSQTGGMASALSDGAITKGAGAILSDAVNGAVEIEVAATVTQRIAYAPEATVDAKYYPLYLVLDK
jgi:hypothetical protein